MTSSTGRATVAPLSLHHHVDLAARKAFNEGCDARLRGEPITANPHKHVGGNDDLSAQWARGWKEVHQFYGIEAKWPIAALPRVRDT